ncbi:hypothetical protein [Bacillus nakamurai]|uniref:hypothetical protein n=1 Tax=Bacillus nakamurai TaxID=1793963 RepID=UPI001E518447|nr:hypothetical protein [Bacillus nakamurai]MCC9022714.1 hypothetical protein [Bacillus nakamurai]
MKEVIVLLGRGIILLFLFQPSADDGGWTYVKTEKNETQYGRMAGHVLQIKHEAENGSSHFIINQNAGPK